MSGKRLKDSQESSHKNDRQKSKTVEVKSSKNTYQQSIDGRATVEILDDASPEGTPRLDVNQRGRLQDIENDRKRLELLKSTEQYFRQMQFNDEKARVANKTDTFVPFQDSVTVDDVERERSRLLKIEEAARLKMHKYLTEVNNHKQYLQKDRLALKIQSLFRGHIGRQKFHLVKRLKSIRDEEINGEWIQVSDPKSGDSWYYNKVTNTSQWNKPEQLNNHHHSPKKNNKMNQNKKSINKLPDLIEPNNSLTPKHQKTKNKNKNLLVSMSLPSLDAVTIGKRATSAGEVEAKKEINEILGVSKILKEDSLTAPDGTFRPELRKTVLNALLETRFDSVSSVLADTRWFEEETEQLMSKSKELSLRKLAEKEVEKGKSLKEDLSRTPLVSAVTFNKKKLAKDRAIESEGQAFAESKGDWQITATQDLNFKEVEHFGFETAGNDDNTPICFGCWSAGNKRKCAIHEDRTVQLKPSQTMLLCRNWSLQVMQRRYRAEEIQELFFKKEVSLRFDAKHKKFSTVIEQRHPLYRSLSYMVEVFNNRMVLFEKVKRWIVSAFQLIRCGKVKPRGKQSSEYARSLKKQMSLLNFLKVDRFSKTNITWIPSGPITGYSWTERLGEIKYLFQHVDLVTGETVDLIRIEPLPVPIKLYLPREYHPTLTRSIPMPKPTYGTDVKVMPSNSFMEESSPAAWLERLMRSVSRDIISSAKSQIQAITPVTQTELMQRTKRPTPNTISFATIGQKPTPDNMAIGGLPLELLIYQLITTFFPAQYGNFMVMDKASVSPGVTIEANISFDSIVMAPILQPYSNRPLEHPLNYRHSPTITANSSVDVNNLHYYGLNKPEQTGEQESHGFRTTTWAPCLLTQSETDPQTFIPGHSVVSLNTPKANISFTTHADETYPFCEPSTRDNSTLDFYHLLLTGVVSISQPQVFTALTCQEPGKFLKDYRTDLPMGHLVVAVYRSWAFTQRETIQEFKTDDGVSYWYHRKTGQTFWERPLADEEGQSPLVGGTILDMDHPEEPTTIHKGLEGAKRRYLQGDFRKQMLYNIENKKEALNRRRNAALTVRGAR